MSQFRSLYLKQTQTAEHLGEKSRPWPATYSQGLPKLQTGEYSMQVRCENQLPRGMTLKQLSTLPGFTESRRVSSQAGWTYYGQWKGVSFQTLFNLFATTHLYPWVRLETMNNEEILIERSQLMNYRLVLECDGEPLSPLYGGPVWIHNFDYYVEYSLAHIKNIILIQGEHEYRHPHQKLGYDLQDARVKPGQYYAIHHEKIASL